MKTNKDYYFFYSRHYFSNWHPSKFQVDGIWFNCGEQYMMWAKAMLFNDTETAKLILATTLPRDQKALGRQVRSFDKAVWDSRCIELMTTGLYAKFSQNPSMREELLSTDDKEIAEASPFDSIWGIGLGEDDDRIWDKTKWLGENKLGGVLMLTRGLLRIQSLLNEDKVK
jgi:ribA/ribD-fused uncharacterized protein